jgi:hypothetical protein
MMFRLHCFRAYWPSKVMIKGGEFPFLTSHPIVACIWCLFFVLSIELVSMKIWNFGIMFLYGPVRQDYFLSERNPLGVGSLDLSDDNSHGMINGLCLHRYQHISMNKTFLIFILLLLMYYIISVK